MGDFHGPDCFSSAHTHILVVTLHQGWFEHSTTFIPRRWSDFGQMSPLSEIYRSDILMNDANEIASIG